MIAILGDNVRAAIGLTIANILTFLVLTGWVDLSSEEVVALNAAISSALITVALLLPPNTKGTDVTTVIAQETVTTIEKET